MIRTFNPNVVKMFSWRWTARLYALRGSLAGYWSKIQGPYPNELKSRYSVAVSLVPIPGYTKP